MMIETAAKTQHRKLIRHIDALQRRIVAVHRLCLDDLTAYAARHLGGRGGYVYLDPHALRQRLDLLHRQVLAVMWPAMAELVAMGGRAGRAVLEAGLKHHLRTRRHREAEGDESDDSEGPPEGSADSIFSRPWTDEPTPAADEEGRALVDRMRLPSLSQQEAHQILLSKNPWGMTWEEQLARSSKLVADPSAMASALAQGSEEGLSLPKLRERIKPFVEDLSNSAQRIARTEGGRIAQTATQRQYDAADKAGLGIQGMVLHCSMGPHSREEHKRRNGWFYEKKTPGIYVHESGEPLPQCPYAPNCMCWSTPVLSVGSETQALIDTIHRRDQERKGVLAQ